MRAALGTSVGGPGHQLDACRWRARSGRRAGGPAARRRDGGGGARQRHVGAPGARRGRGDDVGARWTAMHRRPDAVARRRARVDGGCRPVRRGGRGEPGGGRR
eukprot:2639778-Pleurochrysis_carterae.AAC.1